MKWRHLRADAVKYSNGKRLGRVTVNFVVWKKSYSLKTLQFYDDMKPLKCIGRIEHSVKNDEM